MNSCSRILSRLSRTLEASHKVVIGKNHRVYPRPHFAAISSRYSGSDQSRRPELADEEAKELTTLDATQLLEKEFPDYYKEGKFTERISYIDFIDEALQRLKDLDRHRSLQPYKELLKVFPPGKYCPKSQFDFGPFHLPQQLCAVRILNQMDIHNVIPDKEIERIVISRFSIHSQVWLKCCRMNFWYQKLRNLDPNPLPEVIPKKTHEIAKVALVRMLHDPNSLVTVTNTSSLPNAIDKTWVVYSQSPTQKAIIDRLDEDSLLYIEDAGLTYVQDKYLSYYMLKLYDDEETIKRKRKEPEPDFNFNTIKMNFYGKPIREKLRELEEAHYDGTGYVLALGITGTSSHDSILSWLKILQRRNPKLSKLRVLFKLERPTMDLTCANQGAGGPDPFSKHKAPSN